MESHAAEELCRKAPSGDCDLKQTWSKALVFIDCYKPLRLRHWSDNMLPSSSSIFVLLLCFCAFVFLRYCSYLGTSQALFLPSHAMVSYYIDHFVLSSL